MIAKYKMLRSPTQENKDMNVCKVGKGQVIWSNDLVGDNVEFKTEFDELLQREQYHATSLQDALNDVGPRFSK